MLRRPNPIDRHGIGLAGREAGEVAIAIARGKQPDERGVDVAHADIAARERGFVAIAQTCLAIERRIIAFAIDTLAQCDRDTGCGVGRKFMVVIYVNDGVAIGHDIAGKAPCIAQIILQQHRTPAGGLAIDPVIGAHDRPGLALDDGGAEGGQVAVLQVALGCEDIVGVAAWFRPAMDGEMLGCGDDVGQIGIVALHPLNEGHADPGRQERVFSIGLLAAAPSGIAEEIDVGRPGVEARADLAEMAGLATEGVKRLHLRTDGGRDRLDQRRIECRGEPDRFWEIGGRNCADRAMQRFGPPVIGRDFEPGDGRCHVEELFDFFVQRQLINDGPRLGIRLFPTVIGHSRAMHSQAGQDHRARSTA